MSGRAVASRVGRGAGLSAGCVEAPVSFTLVERSREEELERVVEVVRGWLSGEAGWGMGGGDGERLGSGEIGVFYGVQDASWGSAAIEGLMGRLADDAPSFWLTEPSMAAVLDRQRAPGIRIQPATFAGRVRYRAALLLWADRFPLGTDPSDGSVWGRRIVVATRIALPGDQ